MAKFLQKPVMYEIDINHNIRLAIKNDSVNDDGLAFEFKVKINDIVKYIVDGNRFLPFTISINIPYRNRIIHMNNANNNEKLLLYINSPEDTDQHDPVEIPIKAIYDLERYMINSLRKILHYSFRVIIYCCKQMTNLCIFIFKFTHKIIKALYRKIEKIYMYIRK